MAEITAQLVKELRERTQAGMADCKNALVEAAGDMEKAVEVILKKGLAKSAKRAGAVASEGEVRALVSEGAKSAVLVEVNIQTDFAARNDKFKAFVGDVAKVAAGAKEGDDLDKLPYPGAGKTVGEVKDALIAQIGEKITVRRFKKLDLQSPAGAVHSYVHLGGKIGVLLEVSAESAAVAQHAEFKKFIDDAAMQVAAMAPLYLTRGEIPKAAIDKQREIYTAQLREEPKPKPEQAWPKIIEGKVNKWCGEVCLMEQESVIVPGQTIDQVRGNVAKEAGGPINLVRFVRFERGEGIEKGPVDDFAAEVAKMAGA
ncbi:MAG TPA: translation elongation factor Ts [Polyangiaceae bacterium]|nr:translation elongation factor Ts [Polyangiaceae bacterium]